MGKKQNGELLMDTKVISHVFAAVNSAEKTLGRVESLLPRDGMNEIRAVLPQQKEIVKRMRRVANLLQLEAAREDWSATTRSLRLFYGLHNMVRRDLISAQKTLRLEDSLAAVSEESLNRLGNEQHPSQTVH